MAEHVPIVDSGYTFTALTSADITGGNCCIVSGNGTVSSSAAAAANTFVGVAAHDSKSGAYVTIQVGGIHDLVSSGTVTAGNLVELSSATAGGVMAHTEGTNDDRAIGIALTTAASNVVRVLLHRGA